MTEGAGAGPGPHSRCEREAGSASEAAQAEAGTRGRGTGARWAATRPRWSPQRSWRPWRRTGRPPRLWPGLRRTEGIVRSVGNIILQGDIADLLRSEEKVIHPDSSIVFSPVLHQCLSSHNRSRAIGSPRKRNYSPRSSSVSFYSSLQSTLSICALSSISTLTLSASQPASQQVSETLDLPGLDAGCRRL